MFITRVSVRYPVFTVMMILAIIVVGMLGYSRLALNDMPAMNIPIVSVSTSFPGASPETVATSITKKIEDAVGSLAGVEELHASSGAGHSSVVVAFKLGVDADKAFFEVLQSVNSMRGLLPAGAKAPEVIKADLNSSELMTILFYSSKLDLGGLTAKAEDAISKRLQRVSGVASVEVSGGARKAIRINPNAYLMQMYNVTFEDIRRAIITQHQDFSLGEVMHEGSMRLLVYKGKLTDVEAFRNVIVGQQNGTAILLGDVADVKEGLRERTRVSSYDGQPNVFVTVNKMQTANVVETAKEVHAALDSLKGEFESAGMKYEVISDNAEQIKLAVDNVKRMLFEGALLTILTVFIFLNSWRSTIITSLALPISVIGTYAALYFLGFSLNQMTLLALSLSIGILVDDAIVVRENITRHAQMGKSALRAALDGTTEIGFAVLATTFSIVAVFLPVAFMRGYLGLVFYEFGMTIVVAVLISLFVSFTVDPMLSSVWHDPSVLRGAKRGFIGRQIHKFELGFEALAKLYSRFIVWSLSHRKTVLLSTLFVFLLSVFVATKVNKEFIPASDYTSHLKINMYLRAGAPLEQAVQKIRQVEENLKGLPDVLHVRSLAKVSLGSKYAGWVSLTLKPREEREQTNAYLEDEVRRRLAGIVDASFTLSSSARSGGEEGSSAAAVNVAFNLLGGSATTMREATRTITALLEADDRIIDITKDTAGAIPTHYLRLKPMFSQSLGVTPDMLGSTLAPLVLGSRITYWEARDGESYDVILGVPKASRKTANGLLATAIPMSADRTGIAWLPLEEMVDVEAGSEAAVIKNVDRLRSVPISFSVKGEGAGEYSEKVMQELTNLPLPPGVRVEFTGSVKSVQELIATASEAGFLVIVLIYLVLASQFGSFIQPFSIMMALPLSLTGVALSLYIAGSSFNLFSIIGLLVLMGLVTKNSILLIDYSNHLRKRGVPLAQSLEEAGRVRFRPIIMTSVAMILGMTPLALGQGEGGDALAPMGYTVIGGLVSSTLLTLIVVPVIIIYFDKFEHFLLRYLPFKVDHEGLKALEEEGGNK